MLICMHYIYDMYAYTYDMYTLYVYIMFWDYTVTKMT